MGNGWPVQSGTSVDVDRIDYIISSFSSISRIRGFVLAGWSEEQTSVRGKCQPAEERRVSFISIYSGVSYTGACSDIQIRVRRMFHGPYGGQRDGWGWGY